MKDTKNLIESQETSQSILQKLTKSSSVNESLERDSTVQRAKENLVKAIIKFYETEGDPEFLDADEVEDDMEFFCERLTDDVVFPLERKGII